MQRKVLSNGRCAMVSECLEGVVLQNPELHLIRFSSPENDKGATSNASSSASIVVFRHFKENNVAVISGGGSGHEPAHAGFVGRGMLTAAVAGEIFASPPTAAVLAAIRAVTCDRGCLLIVKNYTGDRLSFGLAAEEAKALGLKVEIVIVGDDCAVRGGEGQRGIAGVILVHKIAGAAASAGCDLAEVTRAAREAAENIKTVGVALSECSVPGVASSQRLGVGQIEIGMGIHGEQGALQMATPPLNDLVDSLLRDYLLKGDWSPSDEPVLVFTNNLGAMPAMELFAAHRSTLRFLEANEKTVSRSLVGTLVTSLDTAGFSITIMKIKNELMLTRLDKRTSALSWPAISQPTRSTKAYLDQPAAQGAVQTGIDSCRYVNVEDVSNPAFFAADVVKAGARKIIELRECLDEIDKIVGDGDCGTSLSLGAQAVMTAVVEAEQKKSLPVAVDIFSFIAGVLQRSCGGSAGALFSLLFLGVHAHLKEVETDGGALTPSVWSQAFVRGVESVEVYGGAKVGMRSLVDALRPAVDAFEREIKLSGGVCSPQVLKACVSAALAGSEATKCMSPAIGRSQFVPEEVVLSCGFEDPGAAACAALISAAAECAEKWFV